MASEKTIPTDTRNASEQMLTATLSEYNMLREEMRMFLGFHRRDTQIFGGLIAFLIGTYVTGGKLLLTAA